MKKEEIFPTEKVVTNKGKIGFVVMVVFCLAFLAIFLGPSVIEFLNKIEADKKKKDTGSDATDTFANVPTNWNKMPDFLEQIKIDSPKTIQKIKEETQENTTTKKIGDLNIDEILKSEKIRSEEKAKIADTELDKINQQLNVDKTLQALEDNEIYLNSRKKLSKSPYEVMAGTIIPATLQIGLNSDLPGNATAIVRQNVYDSVTGSFLLIPKGTKLFGKYESRIAYGQKRLLMQWSRIIFTDGSSISLKDMGGVDKEGYAGFSDQVDNHFANLLSGAILMSIIGTGFQLSQPNIPYSGVNASGQQQAGQVLAGQVGSQIANISGEIVKKNLNIQPTIVIRPGYEFNILVNKDIILEPIGK